MDHFHPTVDTLFGQSSLAIHVQPHLAPQAQADLQGLQRRVADHWPGAFHQAPAHALHVTIYPIVPINDGFDKAAYWDAIAEPSRALVERFCAAAGPFELHFFGLKVTSVGVIAVAQDATGTIERLRASILGTLPPPPGMEHRHYDLIHTTLMRFSNPEPVPISRVQQFEDVPVVLTIRVERIKIFRETLFPCIAGEEIVSVPLGGRG